MTDGGRGGRRGPERAPRRVPARLHRSARVPEYPEISYPAWALSLVAELGLGLWLLVKGVRTEEPAARAPVG